MKYQPRQSKPTKSTHMEKAVKQKTTISYTNTPCNKCTIHSYPEQRIGATTSRRGCTCFAQAIQHVTRQVRDGRVHLIEVYVCSIQAAEKIELLARVEQKLPILRSIRHSQNCLIDSNKEKREAYMWYEYFHIRGNLALYPV